MIIDIQDTRKIWEISTEGDAEGRSTKNLGYYVGSVVDLSLALGPLQFYKLYFREVPANKAIVLNDISNIIKTLNYEKIQAVHVCISGMNKIEILKALASDFINVDYRESNYYESVSIVYDIIHRTKLMRQSNILKET